MAKINEFKKWIEDVKKECFRHEDLEFDGFEDFYGDYKPDSKTIILVFKYCKKGYGDSHSFKETIYLKRKNDTVGFKVISSHIHNDDRNTGYERDKKPENIILKKVTQDFMLRNHCSYYEPCIKDLNYCKCTIGKSEIDMTELKFIKGIRNLEIHIDTWYD
jgi:hypothetical protein